MQRRNRYVTVPRSSDPDNAACCTSRSSRRPERQASDLRAPGVAIGKVAESLARQSIETEWQFTGFLANKRRYEIAELHVTEFTEP